MTESTRPALATDPPTDPPPPPPKHPPRTPPPPDNRPPTKAPGHPPRKADALDDLMALADAVFDTPARRDAMGAGSAISAVAVTRPGGPVQPPVGMGEELTPPSSAVAVAAAACESRRVPDTTPEAGASFGREKSSRPDGGAPGEPPPLAVAADVPDVRARDDGRAGAGAPGAATFTLPPTPPLPSFDDGPSLSARMGAEQLDRLMGWS